jgi:hypothetical protein
VTASGIVGLTWSYPADDGGSPVLDYQISAKIGTGAYTILASGVTTTSYTASSLTAGVVYTFAVTARTAVGFAGPGGSAELDVRAAAKPSVPAAPTTIQVATTAPQGGVTISWIAPANGGSAITAYIVAIC